ncbi:MAG TPA: YpdA family putative bacillithiol disulfide reductase [Trueperaceae bacterium]
MFDLAIVGAGPIGLETAILAKRAGLDYVVLEKGSVVNAICGYPTYMTFFTTSDRLEIGGHPLVSQTDKPTRKEALEYYRRVVQNENLEVRLYTEVLEITPCTRGFELKTASRRPGQAASPGTSDRAIESGRDEEQANDRILARKVAVATGYYDHPKMLGVPGEDLPHVSHYYTEAHPFFRRKVTIVGAGSSAADAALDLFRGGAKVTMIHRGDDFRHSLKYWVRPNLENRVKEGSIELHLNTVVEEITPQAVIARKEGEKLVIPSDQVFLLTGYFAPHNLISAAGVAYDPDTLACDLDEETFESNVPGLYLIGSAGHGNKTSDVFIENGLVHARKAMDDIVGKLKGSAVPG